MTVALPRGSAFANAWAELRQLAGLSVDLLGAVAFLAVAGIGLIAWGSFQ